ncbi:MAG: CsbD family protein [Kiloniellales bacterium]
MNSDEMKGNWNILKGKVRQTWGDLTDDDVEQVAGDRDELVGRIQKQYGITREEAERQVDSWKT